MTKTVTLPLEWVANGDHAEIYAVGPWTAGEIFLHGISGKWAACFYEGHKVDQTYHPDRETARKALESAVLALGVQADAAIPKAAPITADDVTDAEVKAVLASELLSMFARRAISDATIKHLIAFIRNMERGHG